MWSKKDICSFIDLTSLNSFDSPKSIDAFLENAIDLEKKGYTVAAVCFYPNFATKAVEKLAQSAIKVAVVAGNFPNSQGFLSTKLNEAELALEAGVDEIDIVLNLGEFEEGNYENVVSETRAFKGLMPDRKLKVILETGYLKTVERIKLASELAIEGGADFLKTSTGKEYPGASLEAVEVMAKTIAETTATQTVGLKVSGGVRTYEDALSYINIVENYLGKDFLVPEKFRIGASSLVRNLIDE